MVEPAVPRASEPLFTSSSYRFCEWEDSESLREQVAGPVSMAVEVAVPTGDAFVLEGHGRDLSHSSVSSPEPSAMGLALQTQQRGCPCSFSYLTRLAGPRARVLPVSQGYRAPREAFVTPLMHKHQRVCEP